MSKEGINHLKLGIFVATGTTILIIGLYLIGSKRNTFSSNIHISAMFYNVNGLLPGNNVRYAGIDIGTVDKVVIDNDSTVHVFMLIEKKAKDHIKKNSIASIGTEGLMGNKLVSIESAPEPAPPVEEGDVLYSERGVETEDMIRTLSVTNDNVAAITRDLRLFTSKINNEKGVMSIFGDSSSANDIRLAFSTFREVAENTRKATLGLNELVSDLRSGKGLVGTLINDTATSSNLKNTIRNLEKVTDSLNLVAGQLHNFSNALNSPNGVIHALANDTATAHDIKGTVANLKTSSELLNEDLRALQRNFLFRKYFKEKAKKEKKEQKQ